MKTTIPNVDWRPFEALLLGDCHVSVVVRAVAEATGRVVTERAVYTARRRAHEAKGVK